MDWIDFPSLGRSDLRRLRVTLDSYFKDFAREYGASIEEVFIPLKMFLIWFEKLLISLPWFVVLAVIVAIVYGMSRSVRIAIGTLISMCLIGYLGMWDDTMRTIAMITVCALLAISIGIPFGIACAKSDRVQSFVNPLLDMMQTMPPFVYLIPVVMIFGLGKIPGMIAVVVYALPPMIRLTNLGIRLVDKDMIEAADAFGSSDWQKLRDVQLPLALPTIMAGINQCIMMSLAMVVIASMIGVKGLGQPVLQAISNQYFTMGLVNGLAIVAIAILLDRSTQAYGKRLQKHLGIKDE